MGGIAGYNAASGEITGCTASGAISGENATGGIAGQNFGLLLKCENNAGGNLTQTESDLDLTDPDAGAALEELAAADDETYHLLSGCFDTGGIVGWTAGVVQSCVNNGTVHGRKDVGGIVGQAEPYVLVDTGQDTLAQLERELDTLDRLINKALDDAQSAGDSVSAHLTSMGDYTDDARDRSKQLLDRVVDFTDETVDTVNLLVADVTNALDLHFNGLESVPWELYDAFYALRDAMQSVSSSMSALGTAMDCISASGVHFVHPHPAGGGSAGG